VANNSSSHRSRERNVIASFDHQNVVNDAAFSPDGAWILTASADHSAKLWDAVSGKLMASFNHQDVMTNTRLVRTALGYSRRAGTTTAKLWDVASGELIASFAHQNRLWHAAFSPNGLMEAGAAEPTQNFLSEHDTQYDVSKAHQRIVRGFKPLAQDESNCSKRGESDLLCRFIESNIAVSAFPYFKRTHCGS
jgi:WD40 repeat protein